MPDRFRSPTSCASRPRPASTCQRRRVRQVDQLVAIRARAAVGFERRPIKQEAANPFKRGADRTKFAEFYAELDAQEGVATTTEAICVGPIKYTGQAELQRDIDNFKAALKDVKVEEAFLPVAAPASVIPDRKNEYYKNDDELQAAIADAMRTEYKMIVDAGFLLQLDDARSAVTYDRMVPPASFAGLPALAGEAGRHPQSRHRGPAGRAHPLSRLLGLWPGPHTSDVPLKDIVDLILKVKVGAYVIEGANPRHEHEWQVWKNAKLGAGAGAHSRRHQPCHQRGRASRNWWPSASCAWRGLSAARTSSPAPIAALRRGRSIAACIRRSCGRSWRR